MLATSKKRGLKVTTLEVAAYAGAPCSEQLALQIKNTFNVSKLNVSINMHNISFYVFIESITLPVVLYGCET